MTLLQKLKREDAPIAKAQTLDEAANEIRKRDDVGHAEAFSRARTERPDLFAKLQADPVQIAKATTRAAALPPAQAQSEFDDAVAHVSARDGVSRTEAMRRARKERPDTFAALQNS